MSKRFITLTGVILLVLLVVPTYAQARTVFWERWDVVINNVDATNNSFDVQEIYDLYFSGSFSFGSAVIPDENLEAIRNIQVFENGVPLQEACGALGPGTYCVEQITEGMSIMYYFTAPITDGRTSITLAYSVIGALRIYDGGDQLWWTAIPSDHYGFPIGSATVTVDLPDGYGPREGVDPVVTYGAPTTVRVNGTHVVATAINQITGDQKLEIRVQYPHDPNARIAGWQASFDTDRKYEEEVKPLVDIGLIGVSILLALGGPLGMFALWYTRGRDPKVGPVPEYLSEPPSALPPAVVGALVDERADLRDVMSTLIDLAHRGYIVIEERRTEGVVFGFGSNSSFTFKRTDKAIDDLRDFEKNILAKVFKNDLERSMDALKNKFYMYIPQLQDDLYKELMREGLFTADPKATRNRWAAMGGLLLIGACVLGFLVSDAASKISGSLLCVPLAAGVTGAAVILTGPYMPTKTRKGAEEAAKWRAFRQYLGHVDKYRSIADVSDTFDKYLPYAVAFGQDRSWIQRFSRVQNTPVPTWYYPTYWGGRYSRGYQAGTPLDVGGMPSARDVLPGELARAGGEGGFSLNDMAGDISQGLNSISSGLTNMLDSAGRVLTSKPQSSGSSGNWSSGGRSFSGGGSRGGGSSGGGSRGFG